MTAPARALVWSALALAVACGLEQGGQAAGEDDASAGAGGSVTTGGAWGSGGTAGSAGADASLGGVAGVSLGGSAGAAGAPSGGAAGLGGAAGGGGTGTGGLGTGGAATGGTGGGCSAPGTSCGDDSVCCSNLCGPGLAKDVNDCNTFAKCAECDDDGQCGSGRCDACKCEAKLAPPSPCNENSDCQSDKCGPGTAKDPNDCSTFAKCAECDDDGQCGSGRCDACKCEPKQAVGAACNEGSDCLGDRCGPGPVADYMDCNTYGKCAECDADGQCGSGRCDACKCEPKLADGSACNEDSDCVNGWCSGGKCK